jgi:hypothetical protein
MSVIAGNSEVSALRESQFDPTWAKRAMATAEIQ